MPTLTDAMKYLKPKPKAGPLWTGPNGAGPNGGVTQGLISRFLACRERFRLYAIEGLRPSERWDAKLGYGSMWHVCEEALKRDEDYQLVLYDYVLYQRQQYPLQQELITHWYEICSLQFPIYREYWHDRPEDKPRTHLMQEQDFDVPYALPSGREVRLRGRWDAVDLVGAGRESGLEVGENKTKGRVDQQVIARQLAFDLQTQFYLVALDHFKKMPSLNKLWARYLDRPVIGVRYNVVRRPLSSGNAGTIVQHKATKGSKCPKCKDSLPARLGCPKCGGAGRIGAKPEETKEHFYGRLKGIIDGSGEDAPGPDYFFMRWSSVVTAGDIQRFRQRCLDPILEEMDDWYENIGDPSAEWDWGKWTDRGTHYQHPHGCYNPTLEGGFSDVDQYIETGTAVGLRRTEILYPELQESK